MNSPLKNLFAVKNNNQDRHKNNAQKSIELESSASPSIKELKITYYQSGYGDSKNAMGSHEVLESSLHNLYEGYKEECRKHNEEQDELKKPVREKVNDLNNKIKGKSTLVDIKGDEVKILDEKINDLKDTRSQVDADPEKYGVDADKRPKAQFYIGLLVLLPITLYLIVFYVSASYSAFFKTFTTDQISEAIFDAQALSKAMKDGWLEFLFVLTMPFAFMGLGYLIHMFQKTKARLKIAGIVVITFVFDLILAYQIDKKTYEMNKTFDSEPFDLSYAVQSAQFWGIIFAGFVVYIIWGLVFDFIMAEYENFDKVKKFKESLTKQITQLDEQKDKVLKEISGLKHEIAELEGELDGLKAKLNGFIFPQRQYLVLHTEYMKGWLFAIMKEIALPHREQNMMVENCKMKDRLFLDKININGEEIDRIIYTNS